jgi:hypothetical protein
MEMNFLLASGGDALKRLLPNKIQEGEDISPLLSGKPRFPVTQMEAGNYLDSDGNRVNVGNFDSKGLNVNNNSDGNYNDNLGLASARQLTLCSKR